MSIDQPTGEPLNLQLGSKSKQLTWLLRHGAHEQGLSMNEAGWVPVDEILTLLGFSYEELRKIVDADSKQRFQMVHQSIRACQGHSIFNKFVTRDALEASWSSYDEEDSIWHGTNVESVEQIAELGILPLQRTHVHCAPTRDSSIGKRANVAILLEISPDKLRKSDLPIFIAPNGVVLVRHVPPSAIINFFPITKRAKIQRDRLRATLHL